MFFPSKTTDYTLFLAMPVSWKGTLAQYAGRLHRSYDGKQEVLIYDYVDFRIPMLERMYHKRLSGYAAIGYTVRGSKTAPAGDNRWYGGINYLGFEKAAQGAMRLHSQELAVELRSIYFPLE